MGSIILFAGAFLIPAATAAEPPPPWLVAQTNLLTWSAEFLQTRTLRALTRPLATRGHVWFAAPDRFRWELGDPAQTIAVRQTNEMLVIYPRLKRAERYPLEGGRRADWQEMLALLEAGFPRDPAEWSRRFDLLKSIQEGAIARLSLRPKSAGARRWVAQMDLVMNTNGPSLLSTELHFADGSTLRNDFTNATVNSVIADAVFRPALDGDIRIVEPLGKP